MDATVKQTNFAKDTNVLTKDLISRTGAIAHFDKVAEELDEQRGEDSWVGNAFKICLLGVVNDLAVLPSADAVEVVRCKECKYAEPYDDSTYPIHCSYDFPMTEQGTWVKPNDFCSNGERKKI